MSLSKYISIAVVAGMSGGLARTAEAFAQKTTDYAANPPGLILGVWHGLLAPWSLIARFLLNDVIMYAVPNTGFLYDIGFLVGIAGSVHIGWAAAILSFILHVI